MNLIFGIFTQRQIKIA